MKKDPIIRTFETRVLINPTDDAILQEFTGLFANVKHRLFADIASGKESKDLKNSYLISHEITARQFNAARVDVEGKIASIKERQPALIAELKEKIDRLTKKIQKLTKAKPGLIHQKKRRLNNLRHRLNRLEEDHRKGIVRCCFGSKKLFRAQFALEENGYASHEEWRAEWRASRKRELFFLGSKDETAGNQTCTATLNPDQTLELRIRLPNALAEKHGKYLHIPQVQFNYGREEILAAFSDPRSQKATSWRLLRDEKGWRISVTLEIEPTPISSKQNIGALGLDINADHLALAETDRFGNPISTKVIPLNLYGKSREQARALIGDAAATAIAYAEQACKPLIIEDLDFQKKKRALRETGDHRRARMLSSFAYRAIITHLKSRATKKGVLLEQVNPAYTSVIGRVKFSRRYGLSTHQAAALTIGRRYLGCSEKVPSSLREIPDGKESHVTLLLPERNRNKHVWTLWRQVSKKLQTALAAHFRAAKSRSKSPCKTSSCDRNPCGGCWCDSNT